MSESVGVISLDLVIKNKLLPQIEKIKASAKAPAEKLGEALSEAMSKPMDSIEKAVESSVSAAADKANNALKSIKSPSIDIDIADNSDSILAANKAIIEQIGEIPSKYDLVREKVDSLYQKLEILGEKEVELTKIVDGGLGGIAQTAEEWDKAYSALNRVKDQQNAIYSQLGSIGQRARKEIESGLKKPMQETTDKVREKLAEIGSFKVGEKAVPRLKQEIELAANQLSILQKKWQELSASDGDGNAEKLAATEQRILSVQKKIDGLRAKLKELNREKFHPLRAAISLIGKTAKLSAKITGKFFTGTFKAVKAAGGKALSAVSRGFKSIAKSAMSTAKPVSKFGGALARSLKNVFLFSVLYAGFRAIKDGMLDAAKADKQFSESLNAVKANLAVAFTPIVQAIMPALNALMSGLAAVTKQVAGFIAGLFGKTYQQAAVATKKLKSTADAAKKAKLSMAGIDEMNVLSKDESDSSSDDSGTDYGKLDMSEPELPDWAERLKDSIKSGDWAGVGKILAERVNAAFSAVNWDKISERLNGGIRKFTSAVNGFVDTVNWGLIGDKLAGGLNTISSAVLTFFGGINWEELGAGVAEGLNHILTGTNWKQLGAALVAKFNAVVSGLLGFTKEFSFKQLGKSMSTMLNSAVKSINLEGAAEVLGRSIQGIFDAAYEFFTGFDFRGLGEKVGSSINAVITNIDFGKAAQTLSVGVAGIFNTLSGFIQTVDWSGLGRKILEFIKGIDFGLIARSFFNLFGSALGAAVSLIWGALGQIVSNIKNYFKGKIDEAGGNVAKGLLSGILDGLKNIGSWIYNNIFKPFIDGFKKAFGIHSPSKVMGEMGGYIIDGLYNAVSEGIRRIREIFTKMLEAIHNIFANIHVWFGEKFSAAWNKIKEIFSGVGSWFSNRWDDIKEAFELVATWFSDKFSQALEAVKSIFGGIGSWFSDRWHDITGAFSAVVTWFSDKFSGAWTSIKEAFSLSSIKQFFGEVWDAVTSVFSNITDWFRDKFSEAWAAIKGVFTAGGLIFDGIAENIAGIFKETVNSLIDGINWVIAQPINAINDALDGLRNIEIMDFTPFDWLPTIGVPEIPHLAAGGLATAPTLAMVGDNRNAGVDPEVIAPLSKLQGILGDNSEIVELLKTIIRMLESGISAEVIGSLLGADFKRAVLKIYADDQARRGK